MLKFDELMNTWGFFLFHFLKIFIFRPLGTFGPKTLGQPREVKNGTLVLKLYIFWALGTF